MKLFFLTAPFLKFFILLFILFLLCFLLSFVMFVTLYFPAMSESSYNLNLARLHRLQCIFMAFRCHTRTAFCIYDDRDFRQGCFDQKCIGDHADVCTQSDKCNALDFLIFVHRHQLACQVCGAECLFINWFCFSEGIQFASDLPAFGVTDAVRYREFFAFLGVEIPGFMGVSGEEYSSVKGSDFFFYMRYDRNSFFCSKCAIDEIILHIDYYQYFLHLLFFLHLCLNLIFAVCHCL